MTLHTFLRLRLSSSSLQQACLVINSEPAQVAHGMLVHGLYAGQVDANSIMCRQNIVAVLNPAHAK